ncbi:DMT family transporter [Hoeflea sp.]|uniref:DMT family transporter n=1 Tax=Hoeflea sp. TaxID=1940281 RepID=UPI003BB1C86F
MTSQRLPIIVTIVAASAWGLFWLPLRAFEDKGLAAGWATLAIFATPALLLAPPALWRRMRNRPTGAGSAVTGLLVGGAVALYSESVLHTDVARALILFYVTPVWSTILETTLMKRRLTASRTLALALGLGGLVTILGGRTGVPVPQNAGDALALLAGMVWACGSMQVRANPAVGIFETVLSFFVYGSVVAVLLALVPIEATARPPSLAELGRLLPWLVLAAAGFMIPVMWGLLWGSKHIDPGRLGILLQMEAVIGIGSAALLTDEPFGLVEIAGTLLVVGAGVVDVVGENTRGRTT